MSPTANGSGMASTLLHDGLVVHGGTTSNGTGPSNGFAAGPSGSAAAQHAFHTLVEKHVQRVALLGNEMYPPGARPATPASGSAHANGVSGSGRTGKQRATGDEANGMELIAVEEREARGAPADALPVSREDFVRVVLQALRDVGYR